MFRFTRSLLYRVKEYNHSQNIYRPVISKQNFVDSVDTKTNKVDNIDDVNEKNNEFVELNAVEFLEKHININNEIEKYKIRCNKIMNPSELSKIVTEDEARKWSKSLNPSKIIEILKFLSAAKNRPVKLLKVLFENLAAQSKILQLKDCADVMYYMGIFSFKDEVLLNKLAENIIANKQQFKSGGLPASILQSCGILKYRNCKLLDILLQQIIVCNSENLFKSQLTSLLTLATVNYFPPHGKIILNELLKCSMQDFSQTKFFLNFVWACVILNHYSEEHISQVLSENFVNQLKVAEGYFGTYESINLKMLNINAAATYLMPMYKGPKLKANKNLNLASKKKSLFVESVTDGLSHIFPKEGFIQFNVLMKAGFVLDIECWMDSKGDPVPLKNNQNSHKIGIMLLDYNDFCLGKGQVECGLVAFKEKILKAMGYKVVKIMYSEYNMHIKLYEKVHFLQNKFKEALEVNKM